MDYFPQGAAAAQYHDEISDAFINHLKHTNMGQLKQDLETIFAGYAYADAPDRVAMEEVLGLLVVRCLDCCDCHYRFTDRVDFADDYAANTLSSRQKLEILLESACKFPPLMESLNLTLGAIAGHIRSKGGDYQYTPDFSPLFPYPSLRPGTNHCVSNLLSALEDTRMCELYKRIHGTPFQKLFTKDHLSDYLDQLENFTFSSEQVDGLQIFHETRDQWPHIEDECPEFFICLAPQLDPSWKYTKWVDDLTLSLSSDKKYLCIDYIHYGTPPDTSNTHWISEEIDDADIANGTHALLNHACEIIRGHRQGGITQHTGWMAQHKAQLLPILEAQIRALEAFMKAQGMVIPPTPQIPYALTLGKSGMTPYKPYTP